MALYSTSSGYPFPEQKSGLNNNIFRPPLTPGDTSTHAVTPSQDRPFLTRKRTRSNSTKANTSATLQYGSKDFAGNRGTSPAPLANSRYTLAGGFDTPGLAAAIGEDGHDVAGDRDFRWKWDSENMSPDQAVTLGPLARERNGMARMASSSSITTTDSSANNGWGRFVFNIVGGVAGKMWQFCRHSAFKGFYAGGGQGYDFKDPTRMPSPLPGRYPESDFFGDFEQDNTPDRPSKRLHTERGSEWVMVDRVQDTSRLTVRKISSGNLTHIGATRASSRRNADGPVRRGPSRQVSYTGSPQANPRLDAFDSAFVDQRAPAAASTASVASTRSPIVMRPSAALHYRSPVSSPQRNSFGGSRRGSAISNNSDTLSPDAQRYLSRKGRQERDADKSMRKMSRQVQDLIRQGQAALGTKFEVDDFDCDDDDDADGWEDAAAAVRS